MKKTKITRSMCVFLAAAMLPLNAIVTMAAEVIQTAAKEPSESEPTAISEETQPQSAVPDSLELICKSESDTTATLSWNNMFADGSGTYDIYVDSVLIQEDVTETTYMEIIHMQD